MAQKSHPANEMSFDVVVVGGGLAGLTCLERLLQSGAKAALVEGRPRLGGRVKSIPLFQIHGVAELGAEFIHGTPPEVMSRVTSESISIFDVCDKHLFLRNGDLKKINIWEDVEAISASDRRKRTSMSRRSFEIPDCRTQVRLSIDLM